jgi:hypothetical protein
MGIKRRRMKLLLIRFLIILQYMTIRIRKAFLIDTDILTWILKFLTKLYGILSKIKGCMKSKRKQKAKQMVSF